MNPNTEELLLNPQKALYLKAGEMLFEEGSIAPSIFIVQNGVLVFTKKSTRGQESWINFSKPQQFLGLHSLQDPVCPHSAWALCNAHLSQIPITLVQEEIKTNIHFKLKILSALSRQAHQVENQLINRNHRSLKQELKRVILELYKCNTLEIKSLKPQLLFTQLGKLLKNKPKKIEKLFQELMKEGLLEVPISKDIATQ